MASAAAAERLEPEEDHLAVLTYNQMLGPHMQCPSEKHLCTGLDNILMHVTKRGKEYVIEQAPKKDDKIKNIASVCSVQEAASGAPLWKHFTYRTDNLRESKLAMLTGILLK